MIYYCYYKFQFLFSGKFLIPVPGTCNYFRLGWVSKVNFYQQLAAAVYRSSDNPHVAQSAVSVYCLWTLYARGPHLCWLIQYVTIDIGAQSTLGGKTFLPENTWMKYLQNARILHNICLKNEPNAQWFYMIFARKLTKCPNFTCYLPEKYFLPNFGGTCPLPSVSYAYVLF